MTYINNTSSRAIGYLFPILGLFAVVSRFLCRLRRKNELGMDDWLCVPALALVVAMSGILIYGANHSAIGGHTPAPSNTTPEDAPSVESLVVLSLKVEAIFWWFEIPAICFIKLIVLLFYRRIFAGRIFKRLNWFLIGVVIAWGLAFELVQIFACKNQPKYEWESFSTLRGDCVDTFGMMAGNAFADVIIDVVIISFPHFWIWRLNMPLERRIKVMLTFLLGSFAVVAGIMRCVVQLAIVSYSNGNTHTVLGLPGYDIVGVASLCVFWSHIEVGVALVACCLPIMRPMFEMQNIRSTVYNISSRTRLLLSSRSGQSSKDADKSWQASYIVDGTTITVPGPATGQTKLRRLHSNDVIGGLA